MKVSLHTALVFDEVFFFFFINCYISISRYQIFVVAMTDRRCQFFKKRSNQRVSIEETSTRRESVRFEKDTRSSTNPWFRESDAHGSFDLAI